MMHGGLPDDQQQELVESFKRAGSDVRVLVTGDVASEGVNLHVQCHELVHYDIPWSLIRIEQRNGRIDRYGQREPAHITALVMELARDAFMRANDFEYRRAIENTVETICNIIETDDAQEGLAAFNEKRPPRW